jgi:hypothetical protein
MAAAVQSTANELFVVSTHPMKFSRFGEIPWLAGDRLPALRDELRRIGLPPAGPHTFIYTFLTNPHGGRRPPDGDFVLDIAIPVGEEKPGLSPEFAYKRVAGFRYIALRTSDFSEWTTIRNTAEQNGLKRTLVEREVYLPDIVELQEGVE